jgi:hypothetical protein
MTPLEILKDLRKRRCYDNVHRSWTKERHRQEGEELAFDIAIYLLEGGDPARLNPYYEGD